MRLDKQEAMRIALALDVAISIMEAETCVTPAGIRPAVKAAALTDLRLLRSRALRLHQSGDEISEAAAARPAPPYPPPLPPDVPVRRG